MNLYKNCQIETEADAYILGFLYADGFITSKYKDAYKAVGITLSRKDKKFLITISKYFGCEVKNKKVKINGKIYKTCGFYCYNPELVKILIGFGFNSKKTYDNTDKIMDCIPTEFIHHFIRGFFDGDGTVYKLGKTQYGFGFVTLNKKLLERIEKCLAFYCGFSNKKVRLEKGKYARLYYGGNTKLTKIREFLYKDSTLYLNRKKEKFDEIKSIKGINGYRGVRFHSQNNKWTANYKRKYLGIFNTKEEAINRIKNYEINIPITEMDAEYQYQQQNHCSTGQKVL